MKKRMAVLLVLCMVLFSSCGIALTKDGQVAIYSTLDIEKTGYYTTGKDLLSRDMQKNYDKVNLQASAGDERQKHEPAGN